MHFLDLISETLQKCLDLMIAQAYLLWPYWVSGVFLGAVVKQFLRGPRIKDALSRAGRFAIPAGALLGVASPLCLFGALPLLATFGEAGLSVGATWAFLVSSPLLNPNLFILTWGGLGAGVALVRLAIAIGMGITAGFLVQGLTKGRVSEWLPLVKYGAGRAQQEACEAPAQVAATTDGAPSMPEPAGPPQAFSLARLMSDFLDSLAFTGRYLLAGVALAAAVEVLIPQLWVMKALGGPHNGFAVLIATGLGVPLYMCGGGSIPLIREWMYVGGLSMGGAMAFMIAGPSTKVSNFAALIPALGQKGFALYLALNLAGAIVVGYAVDMVIRLHG